MRKRDPLEGAAPARPKAAPVSAEAEIRRRQRGRSLVMALALGAFVVLLYAITIVRMGVQ